MKTIQIAIVDDSEIERKNLEANLVDHLDSLNTDYSVQTYSGGFDFINDFKSKSFDIIFLDIVMDDLNGINVAKKIRDIDRRVLICFVTSETAFAVDSYEVRAFNYLLKPITKAQLAIVVDRMIVKLTQNDEDRSIPVKIDGVFVNIEVDKIMFLESDDKEVIFHMTNKDFSVFGKLQHFDDLLLPFNNFCRCHKSYLVNLDYVDDLKNPFFKMKSGEMIPIPKGIASKVKKQYYEYLLGK